MKVNIINKNWKYNKRRAELIGCWCWRRLHWRSQSRNEWYACVHYFAQHCRATWIIGGRFGNQTQFAEHISCVRITTWRVSQHQKVIVHERCHQSSSTPIYRNTSSKVKIGQQKWYVMQLTKRQKRCRRASVKLLRAQPNVKCSPFGIQLLKLIIEHPTMSFDQASIGFAFEKYIYFMLLNFNATRKILTSNNVNE